jgi:hypothetical protein
MTGKRLTYAELIGDASAEEASKGAGAESDALSDEESPMDRFKAITRRLVRVSKDELQEAEDRYRKRRQK